MNVWMTKWSERTWGFEFSDAMRNTQEKIYRVENLIEDSPHRGEAALRKIINDQPHAFDAYCYLAFILSWRRYKDEAIDLLEKGLSCARDLFPPGFVLGRSQLPWGIIENRPFLRMYEALGGAYLDYGRIEDATRIFEDIIYSNPDDNQGIREDLVECYLEKADTGSILGLCKRYNADTLPAIAYGKVLALLIEGKIKKAQEAMQYAIRYSENVAKEIVKKRHVFIESEVADGVVVGSRHEAYLYWERFGKYWKSTPGAIDFVRNALKKSKNNTRKLNRKYPNTKQE